MWPKGKIHKKHQFLPPPPPPPHTHQPFSLVGNAAIKPMKGIRIVVKLHWFGCGKNKDVKCNSSLENSLPIRPPNVHNHKRNRDKYSLDKYSLDSWHFNSGPQISVFHIYFMPHCVCPFQKFWEAEFSEEALGSDTEEVEPRISHTH